VAQLVRKQQPGSEEINFLPNARRMASLMSEKRAKNIVAYDVRGLTVVADCFVLCTATSEPQLKAVANAIHEGLKEVGVGPLHREGAFSGGWLLLDYGDIIVHIFREDARDFYDLDGLWGDAPRFALDLDERD
jgi:ribosome-associated protein